MRSFLERFNPYVLALSVYSLGLQPAFADVGSAHSSSEKFSRVVSARVSHTELRSDFLADLRKLSKQQQERGFVEASDFVEARSKGEALKEKTEQIQQALKSFGTEMRGILESDAESLPTVAAALFEGIFASTPSLSLLTGSEIVQGVSKVLAEVLGVDLRQVSAHSSPLTVFHALLGKGTRSRGQMLEAFVTRFTSLLSHWTSDRLMLAEFKRRVESPGSVRDLYVDLQSSIKKMEGAVSALPKPGMTYAQRQEDLNEYIANALGADENRSHYNTLTPAERAAFLNTHLSSEEQLEVSSKIEALRLLKKLAAKRTHLNALSPFDPGIFALEDMDVLHLPVGKHGPALLVESLRGALTLFTAYESAEENRSLVDLAVRYADVKSSPTDLAQWKREKKQAWRTWTPTQQQFFRFLTQPHYFNKELDSLNKKHNDRTLTPAEAKKRETLYSALRLMNIEELSPWGYTQTDNILDAISLQQGRPTLHAYFLQQNQPGFMERMSATLVKSRLGKWYRSSVFSSVTQAALSTAPARWLIRAARTTAQTANNLIHTPAFWLLGVPLSGLAYADYKSGWKLLTLPGADAAPSSPFGQICSETSLYGCTLPGNLCYEDEEYCCPNPTDITGGSGGQLNVTVRTSSIQASLHYNPVAVESFNCSVSSFFNSGDQTLRFICQNREAFNSLTSSCQQGEQGSALTYTPVPNNDVGVVIYSQYTDSTGASPDGPNTYNMVPITDQVIQEPGSHLNLTYPQEAVKVSPTDGSVGASSQIREFSVVFSSPDTLLNNAWSTCLQFLNMSNFGIYTDGDTFIDTRSLCLPFQANPDPSKGQYPTISAGKFYYRSVGSDAASVPYGYDYTLCSINANNRAIIPGSCTPTYNFQGFVPRYIPPPQTILNLPSESFMSRNALPLFTGIGGGLVSLAIAIRTGLVFVNRNARTLYPLAGRVVQYTNTKSFYPSPELSAFLTAVSSELHSRHGIDVAYFSKPENNQLHILDLISQSISGALLSEYSSEKPYKAKTGCLGGRFSLYWMTLGRNKTLIMPPYKDFPQRAAQVADKTFELLRGGDPVTRSRGCLNCRCCFAQRTLPEYESPWEQIQVALGYYQRQMEKYAGTLSGSPGSTPPGSPTHSEQHEATASTDGNGVGGIPLQVLDRV